MTTTGWPRSALRRALNAVGPPESSWLPCACSDASTAGDPASADETADLDRFALCGVLVLGCEPEAFACINDPDQSVGTFSSRGTVYGSLDADNPLAVIVHNAYFGGDLEIDGGGGGLNCDSQDALFGSPAYATVEDTSVGGFVRIEGMQTCWLGFFRDSVNGGVSYHDNQTFDPDGNEVETNVIRGYLACANNNPAAQVGDSGGFPNTVFGSATGECASLTGP